MMTRASLNPISRLRRPAACWRSVLLAACLIGGAGGCNVLGVAAGKALPPPRVPAVYELAAVPTAVLVTADPSINGEQGALHSETVAIALERALARQRSAPIVDEASARQAVRVELNPPTAEGALGSDFQHGYATALVRVVDAAGTELWPADGSHGYLVEARTPRVRSADAADLRRATLRALGEQVAALFASREMRPDE